MKKLMKQWIEIEENLKTELEKLLLVLMNSNNINLLHDKLNRYNRHVLLEIEELNLENISDRKLNCYLSYLESELDVKDFEEFLLCQNENNDLNPYLRLYSQLKKEMLKRTKEKQLTSISEIVKYYLAIFEERLLESYEKVFTKQMPEIDLNYLPILYSITYSFVGLEEFASYQIHLKNWIKDIETYQIIEKSWVIHLFYEYLKIIDESPIELLYDEFTMCILSIHFFTILNLLQEYFTLDEIFDKIDESLKEEEKKEFIGCIFLNSKKPYLKVLERMRKR